jgi:hypothetical protein
MDFYFNRNLMTEQIFVLDITNKLRYITSKVSGIIDSTTYDTAGHGDPKFDVLWLLLKEISKKNHHV